MKYHIKVAASGRLEFWKSRCVAKTHLKTISLAPAARSGCCGLTRAVDGIVAAHEKLSSSVPRREIVVLRAFGSMDLMVGFGKVLIEFFFP